MPLSLVWTLSSIFTDLVECCNPQLLHNKSKANALIGRLAICPLVHANEKLQPVAKVLETLNVILHFYNQLQKYLRYLMLFSLLEAEDDYVESPILLQKIANYRANTEFNL